MARTRKPRKLTQAFNVNGSITLYASGRKVQTFTGYAAHRSIEAFAKGWYGTETPPRVPMDLRRSAAWCARRDAERAAAQAA